MKHGYAKDDGLISRRSDSTGDNEGVVAASPNVAASTAQSQFIFDVTCLAVESDSPIGYETKVLRVRESSERSVCVDDLLKAERDFKVTNTEVGFSLSVPSVIEVRDPIHKLEIATVVEAGLRRWHVVNSGPVRLERQCAPVSRFVGEDFVQIDADKTKATEFAVSSRESGAVSKVQGDTKIIIPGL